MGEFFIKNSGIKAKNITTKEAQNMQVEAVSQIE